MSRTMIGAQPVFPLRMKDLFDRIRKKENINLLEHWLSKMGEFYFSVSEIFTTAVGSISDEISYHDTKRIAKEMVRKGIELLIFVGGDGTARDICDAIGLKVPVITGRE